jgi:hypothetical protein
VLRTGHQQRASTTVCASPPQTKTLGRIGTAEGGTKVRIDIDGLTEAELVDLNNRIVERLRFLHQARSHKRMLDFKIGDRVSFQPEGRAIVVGILTRYNKRTVTVITEAGERWNVAPNLLHRIVESSTAQEDNPNVVPMRKK